MKMKMSLVAIATLGLAMSLASCSSDPTPAATAGAGDLGTMVVASTLSFPPFEMTDESGQPTGLEVDLIEQIAERAGYSDVEWMTMQFEGVIPGVAAGKVDVGASGITGWSEPGTSSYDVVVKRTEQVSFSRPWFIENGMIVTTDPDLTNVDDLESGMRVAVADGSQYFFWAQENLAPKGIELVAVKHTNEAYTQLEAGLVDALIDGRASSGSVAAEKPEMVVGDPIADITGGFAWAVAPENTAMLTVLNDGLADLIADGTYEELYAEYLPGVEMPELPTNSFVAE